MDGPFGTTYGIQSNTGLLLPVELVKLQDEARTNTVAFTNDNTLAYGIGTNETIYWEASLIFGGNSPGDAKVQFATPAAPVSGGILGVVIPAGLAGAVANGGLGLYNAPFLLAEDSTGVGDEFPNVFWGRLVNGVNGGVFSVQWAQNGLSAVPSLMLAGSRLRVWRLNP